MFNGKRVIVVMPAYNAAKTLHDTHREVMSQGIVDLVIVVDDRSRDDTATIARQLPNTIVHVHDVNRGYGGNQKTCYRLALENGADIVIMVHPDYQYTPLLLPAMTSIIGNGLYACVLGSRILGDPRACGPFAERRPRRTVNLPEETSPAMLTLPRRRRATRSPHLG